MWRSEGEREWEDLELPVLWRLLSGISPWRLWPKNMKYCWIKIITILNITPMIYSFFYMLKHPHLFNISFFSKAAVLLPKGWEAAQRGDRRRALATTALSGGLTVNVIVVTVQVVVTRRAKQRPWWGQGAGCQTSTVGVGGGLPERHWGGKETQTDGKADTSRMTNQQRALKKNSYDSENLFTLCYQVVLITAGSKSEQKQTARRFYRIFWKQ